MDFIRISGYETITKRGDGLKSLQDQVYYELKNGSDSIDWNRLDGALEFVANQYDCSDFRLVNLIRMLYEFGDRIPPDYLSRMEKILFNFRYWWDEPGENSMCYWSENHQILFASAEYLIGQRYPDSLFGNSGLNGKEHQEKARKRILDWLEMRWNYGFTEFYSAAYYPEDVGALINLIDFSNDNEIMIKSQIVLDLLFYDVATQSIKNMFISTSGRAYERGRTGAPWVNNFRGLTRYLWGDGQEIEADMIYGMINSDRYEIPLVISAIAKDTSTVIIRQSNGLNIADLKEEGYYGVDDRSMMMQWGMESFTNPEIIRNSISHIRSCNMFSNKFVADFKYLDFTAIRLLHLEPFLSEKFEFQSNGAAIQEGNTYTFKTKDYSLYTVQKYHPGTYGTQQHVAGINIGNHYSIYHMHPARIGGDKDASPGYWVGYGHLPHSVQDQNVNLSIYNTPEKKAIFEFDLIDFTHAYFPVTLFDTTYVENNYAFGKKGESYCAFIGANAFELKDGKDLVQPGKKAFWITEAGSQSEDGSFEYFIERIKVNDIKWDSSSLSLSYKSQGRNYQTRFNGDFSIDDAPVDLNYKRYDSPYVTANKKDKVLKISFEGESLFLDFENMKREIR